MQNLTPPWKAVRPLPSLRSTPPSLLTFAYSQPWVENLTGTRGAYRSYNTCKPKIEAWQPKVAPRSASPK